MEDDPYDLGELRETWMAVKFLAGALLWLVVPVLLLAYLLLR